MIHANNTKIYNNGRNGLINLVESPNPKLQHDSNQHIKDAEKIEEKPSADTSGKDSKSKLIFEILNHISKNEN